MFLQLYAMVGFKILRTGSLTPGLTNNRCSRYNSLQRQTMLLGSIEVQSLIFVLPTATISINHFIFAQISLHRK